MKKKFVFIMCFLFFILFSGFSDLPEDYANDVVTQTKEDEDKQKEYNKGLNFINNLENSGKIAESVANIIDNLALAFINIHNQIFGMEKVSSALKLPSFSFEGRFNLKSGSIFKWLLSLAFVVYILVFVIKTVSKANVQYAEILDVAKRSIFCMITFLILPYMPTFLINLVFRFAELISGSTEWTYGATTMSFSTPIHMTKSIGAGIIGTGVASLLLSVFEFSAGFIVNIGTSFTSISTLTMLIFGVFMGGILVSFVVAIQFLIKCLDLYITNLIMILVLPGSILKGWGNEGFLGYDIGTLVKYYIVNTIEIFIAALIILIVKNIFSNLALEVVAASSDASGTSKFLLSSLVVYLAQPLLMLILLPASSKILSSLLNGSVSNTDTDVSGAAAQTMRGVKTSAGFFGVKEVLNKQQKLLGSKNRGTLDFNGFRRAKSSNASTTNDTSKTTNTSLAGARKDDYRRRAAHAREVLAQKRATEAAEKQAGETNKNLSKSSAGKTGDISKTPSINKSGTSKSAKSSNTNFPTSFSRSKKINKKS